MNKMKIISSVVLGLSVSSLSVANSNAYIANASSASIYSLTNQAYNISFEDNSIFVKFKSVDTHNKITNAKLYDSTTNKFYDFEKNSNNFKLTLKEELKSGNYILVFNDTSINNSNSREMYAPIYINFPETSAQNVSITSLNPLVSLINSNGIYKLNARFNILNIQDTITDGKILNDQGTQIGFLENKTNPRNYIFNLGSNPLNIGSTYFIEYTLKDSKNVIKKIKIPFTYTSNSIHLNALSTRNFVYKSNKNPDNTVKLTLKFANINPNDITFYDAQNVGIQLVTTSDEKGNITLDNLTTDKIIQVHIKDEGKVKVFNFKVPDNTIVNDTPIPFIKFLNTTGLVLKQGVSISVPVIKEDVSISGFTTPNTYAKFVAFDDFGNETDLTNEVRISNFNSNINFTANMNVGTLQNSSVVYLKVYSPTKSIVYPFNISTSTANSQSLAFDVIKNNTLNNKVSIIFRPNGNVLSPNDTFSNGDTLVINDSINATLSTDKKSFNVEIPKNQLKNGTNTYTFIRNNSSGTASYITGEFIADTSISNIKLGGIVDSITSSINNQKELILRLDLNNSLPNINSYTSVKVFDEQGRTIESKSSIKQTGLNKYLEIAISPYTKLINGRNYTLEIGSGTNSFRTNFVYNKDTQYKLDLGLVFNSKSNITLKNLSTVPGSSHNYNIKIFSSSNESDVIYENFNLNTQGELLKEDTITRDLISGKKFVDGNNYTIQLRDTVTGDIYKQPFTYRDSDLVSTNSGAAQLDIKQSSLQFNSDGITFDYALPSKKTVSSLKTGIEQIKATYANGKITLTNLVPTKLYKDLYVLVTFSDGTTQNLKIGEFTSQSSNNKLANYISKVYTITLTPVHETDKNKMRYADEAGFAYWFDLLSNSKITGSDFILKILDANEFNRIHSNSQDKIRALYPIVVNRLGDNVGINFWINDFNESLKKFNSEDLALKNTILKMVNETEPQQFFSSLGIRIN